MGVASGFMHDACAVHLELWDEGDLPLLESLNAPEMKLHLGGPESSEKVADRQRRYQQMPAHEGRAFKVVDDATGTAVGSVLYWDREWRDEDVFEIGWAVLPEFQGRGIATAAVTEGIVRARSDGRHPHMYAFPSVDNVASNAVCRKTGFTVIGECDFEYPKGSFLRCNEWRHDLATALAMEGGDGESSR